MKVTFEGATAIRPNPQIRNLTRLALVFAGLLVVAAIELGPELLVAAVVISSVAALAGVILNTVEFLALKSREPLAAAREGLYEGERLLLRREQVRAALPALHREAGPALLLLGPHGAVLVKVVDRAMARRLEQALELDAEHSRMRIRFRVRNRVRMAALAALGVVLFAVLRVFETPMVFVVGALLAWPLTVWSTTLTIGEDGLGLRTFGRERFIPYSDIESVQAVEANDPDRGVAPRISLRSGSAITLARSPELQPRFGFQIDEPVDEHAQAALQRYRDRAKRAPVLPLALSARATGSPADRVRALTQKEHGGDVYRRIATDEEGLRRAVDEPTLPPRVRAEAAVALGGLGDADDLERIRYAAERSANAPLRELFDAVAAKAGDAQLAHALGRVR